MLGGSEGGLGATLPTAALLASHGYAALAVAYFGPIGNLPRTLENVPLEYFANAITLLREQPNVDATRLGVLGFSRGDELALLLGSYYPDFTAVVSYNGSGLVIASPSVMPYAPARSWQGEDLEFALTLEDSSAEIPVERTNGPALLISGDGDTLWESSALSQVAWDRLQRTEHPWPDQFLRYPGAGHGIMPPYGPMTFDRTGIGGDPHSDQIASVNSWRAVLNMLEWRLKHGG